MDRREASIMNNRTEILNIYMTIRDHKWTSGSYIMHRTNNRWIIKVRVTTQKLQEKSEQEEDQIERYNLSICQSRMITVTIDMGKDCCPVVNQSVAATDNYTGSSIEGSETKLIC